MDNKRPARISGKMKWGLLGLVSVFFLYTITGFILLPALMKHLLLKNLREFTQREVRIHGVSTNPFKFTVKLEGFSITSKKSQEKLASFKEIFINIESPSVIKWAFMVDEMKIVEPSLRLVRDKDNRFNVSDILTQGPAKGKGGGSLLIPRLSLKRIQIVNGRLEFLDELEEERHLVEEIHLDIPLISNMEETGGGWVKPHLSAKVNGAPLSMDGKVSPFSESKETHLRLDMKAMNLRNYLAYIPDEWNLKFLSGVFSLQTKVAFSRTKEDKFVLNLSGVLGLKDLEVTDRDDKKLLKLSNLRVDVAALDPASRSLHLSEVSMGPFEVHVRRDETGKVNLQSLAASLESGEKKTKKGEGVSPFRFQIDEMNLREGTAYFTDQAMGEPFATRLEVSNLTVQGLHSDRESRASYALSGKTGFGEEIVLKGRISLNPLSSEGSVEIKNIPAEKYGPYYRQHISFDMGSPLISVGASYRFAGVEADPDIQLSNAWASLHSFRVKPGDGSREMAEIPVLNIKGVQFNLKKREMKIRELNSSGGRLFLARDEQGALNLQQIFQPKAGGPESISAGKSQTHDEGWSLMAEKVQLDDYSLKAEDRMGEDPVSLGLKKADLRLEGIQAKMGASGPDLQFSGVKASLDSLKFGRVGDSENMVDIPILTFSGADFRLKEKRFKVREVASEGGQIHITRFDSGKLNLKSILPVSTSHEIKTSDRGKDPTESGRGWEVSLDKAQFKGFRVKAEDRLPAEPLSMEFQRIDLDVQNLSTQEKSRGRLLFKCKIKEKGSANVDGSIGVNPLFADLNVDLKNLSLPLAQSYLPSSVKVKLTGGKLSTRGVLQVKEKESREGWLLDFKGGADLAGFSAIDTIEEKELLSSKTLKLTDIHFGNEPARFSIKRAYMEHFRMLTEIGPDGVFNIFRVIFEKKRDKLTTQATPLAGDKAGDQGKRSAPLKIRIDEMIFQDGSIYFSDKLIKPNFEAKFLDIGGKINDLSSEEGVRAQVALQGNLGGTAPVKIAGQSSPLGKETYVDMNILFENIDITRMNIYARKYLGYNIEKGKLYLDLKYNIVKDKIESQNKLLLEKFTLGERVESPEAIKVPLETAISLLKDREGNISLNIPVSGRLSDPKFDLGEVYSKTFQSLFTNIVTAPFSFIGAVFGSGGGEELGYLEFDYGSSKITGDSAKKLDTLITALHERPKLNLEISGYADPEKDGNALIESLFLNKLKKEKIIDLAKRGGESVSPEDVTLERKEYGKYLQRAYLSELSKESQKKGGGAVSSVEEMEKVLRSVTIATGDDLALLAQRRAVEVNNYVMGSKKVNSKRIFLVKPKALSPVKLEGAKDSRVILKFK
ncbi:MAG: DUF748 domain-containing protein [Pseudomonadota bacterium]